MFDFVQVKYYVMSNNITPQERTGRSHFLEYLPGHAYCFIPSFDANQVDSYVYPFVPDFVKEFSFYMEIEDVRKQEYR